MTILRIQVKAVRLVMTFSHQRKIFTVNNHARLGKTHFTSNFRVI